MIESTLFHIARWLIVLTGFVVVAYGCLLLVECLTAAFVRKLVEYMRWNAGLMEFVIHKRKTEGPDWLRRKVPMPKCLDDEH